MPTLAELRSQKRKSLPTRVRRITLDLELLADVQRLEEEKRDLMTQAGRKAAEPEDRDGSEPVRKMAEGVSPRVAEIDAELSDLHDRLRESEGELLLRGTTGGEWQRWKDENPPREGNVTDSDVAFGLCDATALLNDLSRYVVSWNGEDFAPGDWGGWFAERVAPGDLRDLVSDVVSMHELSGVRAAPKSQSPSSSTGDESNG